MAKITKPTTSKQLAVLCAKIAMEKLATDVIIMDISQIDGAPSDYFLVASCQSEPQLRACAEAIETTCKQTGVQAPRSEGWEAMQWILIDFFDVVVHLFKKDARDFYKIEKLWGDAEMMTIGETGRTKKYILPKVKTNRLDED